MNQGVVPSRDARADTPAGTGSNHRPARPQPLALRPETIPNELARYHQWVGWTYRWDGQVKAWKKPPRSPRSGGPASVTNPATWGSFTEALDRAAHPDCDGIGFVVTTEDPFAALDLDHCISPNQQIAPWALAIVDTLNSYTERSPSGRGLRIFLRGTLPKPGSRQGPVEVYGSGRHVTVTGHHLEGTPTTIEQRDVELTKVYRSIFGDPAPAKEPLTGSSGRGAVAKAHPLSAVPSAATRPSDDRIL